MERQYVEGRVSVITPVYNVEKYIDKTLESIFAQTYKDIEIVLVDDCSKDNSAQIIARYKENIQKLYISYSLRIWELVQQEIKHWNLPVDNMLHFWIVMTCGCLKRQKNKSS